MSENSPIDGRARASDTADLFRRVWRFVFGAACPGAITIGVAGTKHLVDAGILLSTPKANDGVGMAAMLTIIPNRYGLALFLVVCAGLAVFAQRRRDLFHLSVAFLLLPQQIMLFATFTGALCAVFSGMYADDVVRPSMFILADQLPRILLAPAYTWAIFARAGFADAYCKTCPLHG